MPIAGRNAGRRSHEGNWTMIPILQMFDHMVSLAKLVGEISAWIPDAGSRRRIGMRIAPVVLELLSASAL